MQDPGSHSTGPHSPGPRIARFVAIGAVIGVAVLLLTVAILSQFDYDHNWLWVFAIVGGAVGGGIIGLLLSAAGRGHGR